LAKLIVEGDNLFLRRMPPRDRGLFAIISQKLKPSSGAKRNDQAGVCENLPMAAGKKIECADFLLKANTISDTADLGKRFFLYGR